MHKHAHTNLSISIHINVTFIDTHKFLWHLQNACCNAVLNTEFFKLSKKSWGHGKAEGLGLERPLNVLFKLVGEVEQTSTTSPRQFKHCRILEKAMHNEYNMVYEWIALANLRLQIFILTDKGFMMLKVIKQNSKVFHRLLWRLLNAPLSASNSALHWNDESEAEDAEKWSESVCIPMLPPTAYIKTNYRISVRNLQIV